MSDILDRATWTVGADGSELADIGGSRYCVDHPTRKGDAFRVLRDGVYIAAPECLSGPAGYKTAEAAKKYAEWHAAMRAPR